MQLIEISSERRHLSSKRGFLCISEGSSELSRVPFDNILGVIGAAHGITLSQSLLVKLGERGIPYVTCDKGFRPVSVCLPISAHHWHTGVVASQMSARRPLQKQMWKAIVVRKITNQAKTLEATGQNSTRLTRLASTVKNGDPDNHEAQAARVYWPRLLGEDFRRQRKGEYPNDLLNYGYMVMRAAMARAVVACGLCPAIGLNHCNRLNPMVLVDDLVEPFRPFVDMKVHELVENDLAMGTEAKNQLVSVLHTKVENTALGRTLNSQIHETVRSLVKSLESGKCELSLPHAAPC